MKGSRPGDVLIADDLVADENAVEGRLLLEIVLAVDDDLRGRRVDACSSEAIPAAISPGSPAVVTKGSLVVMKLVRVWAPSRSPLARAFSTHRLNPARPLGKRSSSRSKWPQVLKGPLWYRARNPRRFVYSSIASIVFSLKAAMR